jgi:RTX calcium-binding nonapeptide repeat (4 copies)
MHYRTKRRQTRRALLAAAVALVALPAAAAQAAEVTAVGTEIIVEDKGGFMVPTQHNRLIAEALPGGELRLVDQVPLVSKTATCLNVTSTELRCIRPSTSPISKLVFRAGDGDDQLRPAGSLPIEYKGGDGDDLYVGARTAAGTRVDFEGGSADDDLAHYTNAETGVNVTKDNLANDGRPGGQDRDNIHKDVDVVTGTHFDDRFGGVIGEVDFEEFRPLGGDDAVFGADGITTVDMGSAKDGADRVVAGVFTEVSYAKRTNPIRVGVDLEGANDGETGERDELVGVHAVVGGNGDDTLFAASRPDGITLDGGPGDDTVTGTTQRDRLTGGLDRDTLVGRDGSDTLTADEGDIDRVLCGGGLADVAFTDTAEEEISGCETRKSVGTLRLTPKALHAEAGETTRLELNWRHPTAWKQLRTIELRLTRAGAPVGEVTIRPRGERISADGAVKLDRAATRLTTKGKLVRVRLALQLDQNLAGRTLKAEVEATDKRGQRQLERGAGTVRIAE